MRKITPAPTPSTLVLGWRVTHGLDPKYWLSPNAKPGAQDKDDLVTITAEAMAAHSVIIAQSGSGKSFFLGRLLEELLLQTRARCVVLDPNADFRLVSNSKEAVLWETAKYDIQMGQGFLPHESSRGKFVQRWDQVTKIVRTARPSLQAVRREPLRVWWPAVPLEFIADDTDALLRSALYHCHAFTKAIGHLIRWRATLRDDQTDVLDEVGRLYDLLRTASPKRDVLEQEFNGAAIAPSLSDRPSRDVTAAVPWIDASSDREIRHAVEGLIDHALKALAYVTDESMYFYLGKAREFQAEGIVSTSAAESLSLRSKARLELVDLASLSSRTSTMLVVSATLSGEWEDAKARWFYALSRPESEDQRVPTFIVVDEAHNLVPENARDRPSLSLREQFRTVAAEGRKYGVFLILVSQRPDKLDPLVVSECQNKAIMRLGSETVLEHTRAALGLEDADRKLLARTLEFGVGRVLIAGRWAPNGLTLFYGAARRTTEGGRDIPPSWATRPEARGAAASRDVKESDVTVDFSSQKGRRSKRNDTHSFRNKS